MSATAAMVATLIPVPDTPAAPPPAYSFTQRAKPVYAHVRLLPGAAKDRGFRPFEVGERLDGVVPDQVLEGVIARGDASEKKPKLRAPQSPPVFRGPDRDQLERDALVQLYSEQMERERQEAERQGVSLRLGGRT